MLLWPACTSFSVIVLDRSARLHIDPTVLHDWDQYFQFSPPGFDQRERSSYTNCHFYRDTHSRRDEWKKRVLLSPGTGAANFIPFRVIASCEAGSIMHDLSLKRRILAGLACGYGICADYYHERGYDHS